MRYAEFLGRAAWMDSHYGSYKIKIHKFRITEDDGKTWVNCTYNAKEGSEFLKLKKGDLITDFEMDAKSPNIISCNSTFKEYTVPSKNALW